MQVKGREILYVLNTHALVCRAYDDWPSLGFRLLTNNKGWEFATCQQSCLLLQAA